MISSRPETSWPATLLSIPVCLAWTDDDSPLASLAAMLALMDVTLAPQLGIHMQSCDLSPGSPATGQPTLGSGSLEYIMAPLSMTTQDGHHNTNHGRTRELLR